MIEDVIKGSGGGGKGGGGSARTPVEAPDNLHNTSYAVILDLISNGPVYGPAHPDDPMRDIYLDGTPIQNADGSLNYTDVQVEYRTGTQDQSYIPGFPAASSVTNVGQEVRDDQSWTQLITNTSLSALRVTAFFPRLLKTIGSGSRTGDRVGTSVSYVIELSTDGGSFQEVTSQTVTGKTTTGYARTSRIELPEAQSGWTVRVRRTSANSTDSMIEDSMTLQSYAEVIDGKFRYPMSATNGTKVSADQFQSIPTRAFDWFGRLIRVPSNYDPESRTYTGTWDGTFKTEYSDNPAWVLYDMITSNLYGLGDRVDASMIDRYALYQIAVYCDETVSDGQGGTEPRFVCSAYMQGQADALKVLNDFASVFRGMSFWANGQVVAAADMPSDPVYVYNNANVIGGRFEYTGSDINTRKTVALVSYNDPDDFYRSKVETVYDRQGILRYGIRQMDVVAFGCASRSQAQRVGLYQLYTSRMETGGVAFEVGIDGIIPAPGKIIKIADYNRAGRAIGGRISSATIDSITIDRDVEFDATATLTIITPDGEAVERDISSISGRTVTVQSDFDEPPVEQSVWAVSSDDLSVQFARVVSISEKDAVTYSVNCVFHSPGKFDAIDNGVRVEDLPISVVPPRVQTAPDNIEIAEHYTYHQGTTRHYAEITWDAPTEESSLRYDVQWRRDNSDWVSMPRTGVKLAQIDDVYQGLYEVRVRAINALDVPSLWAYADPTALEGIVAEPPVVESLRTISEVMAITLEWSYPDTPNIISKVEIYSSADNNFNNATFLTEISYPAISYTLVGLSNSAEIWFWVRLIDKNGTQGAWYPDGAGELGIPSQDPAAILDYLEGEIGQGQLAPGLVDEISEDVSTGIIDEVIEDITGPLSGDTEVEGVWYAGDDSEDETYVGSVTVTSVINEGDYKLAREVSTLFAQIDNVSGVIQEFQEVVIDEFGVVAERTNTIASQIDDAEALIVETAETIATLEGDLEATWQVQTQVRQDGRVVQAGVGLGASIGADGQSRSEFIVMADTVAFINSIDGELHTPFVFDTQEDTAYLDTAFIADATIDFAKISDTIQSTNWNPTNKTGWQLKKNGDFTIYGNNGQGGYTLITNANIKVFDESDVMRVRMGYLLS